MTNDIYSQTAKTAFSHLKNRPLKDDGGKTCKAVDGKGKEFALVIVESLISEKTLYSICYLILKTTRLGSVKDDSVSISKLMVLRTSQSDSYPTGNPQLGDLNGFKFDLANCQSKLRPNVSTEV